MREQIFPELTGSTEIKHRDKHGDEATKMSSIRGNKSGHEVTIPGILKPIRLEPGQFISGRHSLHEDYHQAQLKKRYSRKAAPTAITLYRWLLNLEKCKF